MMKPPRPRHGDPVMGSLWRLVLGHVKGGVGRGVVGSGKWESGEVESIERKSVEQCGGQRRGLTVRRCVAKQNP